MLRARRSLLPGLMLAILVVALVVVLLTRGGSSTTASRGSGPLAMFQEPAHMLTDPAGTLATLQSLGVGVLRMQLQWQQLAPAARSATRPAGFNAADPRAYGVAWAPYDAIVNDAHREGIPIDFSLMGGAPLWATGPDAPAGPSRLYWEPSASEFGQFVRAAALRYSGSYRPCSTCAALPRVSFWELWNEPNFGGDLAPQATAGSTVATSAKLYRDLLDAGWSAVQAAGHGHYTIVMGSLSPRGFKGPVSHRFPQGLPGYFSTTKPLQFLRALYCVDGQYRRLEGSAASSIGCPSTANAQQFLAQHPGLFHANGFGIHPYPFDLPPTQADSNDPDYAEFTQIPRLASTLDRLQHAYGSSNRMQIYNTEFGYITDPPNATTHYGRHFPSPETAAYYLNWAEYLSWKNPRIATTMQYLLYDPYPTSSGFATGLLMFTGVPKVTFDAYRLPLFLPITSAAHGDSLEVWGCVRPAHYASGAERGRPPRVQILFRGTGERSFQTLATVPIQNAGGYFEARVAFPTSGAVRLSWSYPSGQTVYSRTVAVTIH